MQTLMGIDVAFEPIFSQVWPLSLNYWRTFFSGLAIVVELLPDEYLFGVHMDFVPRFILLSDGALKRLHLKWLRQVDMV